MKHDRTWVDTPDGPRMRGYQEAERQLDEALRVSQAVRRRKQQLALAATIGCVSAIGVALIAQGILLITLWVLGLLG